MVAVADGDIVEVSQFIQQTAAGKVRRITRLKKH